MLDKSTYRTLKSNITINESNEKLIEIPSEFLRFSPHPYETLNAPYEGKSPFFLRSAVVERLKLAQARLHTLKRGYKLKIFDAYRPLSVQKFMIEYDTNRISLEMFDAAFRELLHKQKMELQEIISHFWSPIGKDIVSNPPPHSTGGALDLTIVDSNEVELDMGTAIDALVDASESNYYKDKNVTYQRKRELLVEVMSYAGFVQLPTEWWHFSYGDQIWALDNNTKAKYGIYNKSV